MNVKKTIFPYSLLILSSLTAILLVGRVVLFHSHYYDYLAWNIFLALIPFCISGIMIWLLKKNIQTKAIYISMGLVWLFFFPNAPYIVTDLLHIGKIPNSPILYDTFVLFSSAWLGLLFGFYSLLHIEKIIEHFFSVRVRNISIVFIFIFTSLGIYIGRFLRFNTWDVPAGLSRIIMRLHNVVSQPKTAIEFVIFTVVTFIFLLLAYYSWKYDKNSSLENML